MTDPDLIHMQTAKELDEFAAWAHAVEATEGVTVVEDPESDVDAPHGSNTEDEMLGD